MTATPHVLIVDDSGFMRAALGALAQSTRPCTTAAAEDADEARAMIRDRRPDLIITDYAMPPVDGLAFARQVRAEDTPASRAPIIMVSGYHTPELTAAAHAAGVDAVLSKPLDVSAFVACVRDLLGPPPADGADAASETLTPPAATLRDDPERA